MIRQALSTRYRIKVWSSNKLAEDIPIRSEIIFLFIVLAFIIELSLSENTFSIYDFVLASFVLSFEKKMKQPGDPFFRPAYFKASDIWSVEDNRSKRSISALWAMVIFLFIASNVIFRTWSMCSCPYTIFAYNAFIDTSGKRFLNS